MPNARVKTVLRMAELPSGELEAVLTVYGLSIARQNSTENIIGSFWGDDEAGLVGNVLYVRSDTPVHSALHEACHYICMDESRRAKLHTNAGGDYDEENAVCYLQILLASALKSMGVQRMLADMDSWGYSYRLGSAKRWFYEDAEDAQHWLEKRKLLVKIDSKHWLLLSDIGLISDSSSEVQPTKGL